MGLWMMRQRCEEGERRGWKHGDSLCLDHSSAPVPCVPGGASGKGGCCTADSACDMIDIFATVCGVDSRAATCN